MNRSAPVLMLSALWAVSAAAHPGAVDSGLLTVVDDPYVAAKDAEAVVVLTEWPEFRALDWGRLAETVAVRTLVDTRNLLDPAVVRRAGFGWVGIGRPEAHPVAV